MKEFQQKLTEESYFRQEELVFADCDRYRRARISTLLTKVASFAGYDCDARGVTYEKLAAQGEVFLLSRISLKIHRSPLSREILDITTWEKGIRGPRVERIYEMLDQEGRLCVSARSDWILVDPASRKILRPEQYAGGKIGDCGKEVDCPPTRRLRPLRDQGELWGCHKVVWSDLDGNGHLYSGRYGDVIWDALPADLRERMPREFHITYHHEATLDQTLELWGLRTETGFCMEGRVKGGVCFCCESEG